MPKRLPRSSKRRSPKRTVSSRKNTRKIILDFGGVRSRHLEDARDHHDWDGYPTQYDIDPDLGSR